MTGPLDLKGWNHARQEGPYWIWDHPESSDAVVLDSGTPHTFEAHQAVDLGGSSQGWRRHGSFPTLGAAIDHLESLRGPRPR